MSRPIGLSQKCLTHFTSNIQLRTAIKQLKKTQYVSPSLERIQNGWCSLYSKESVQPYIPVAAQGPWIGTSLGGIIYDVGGYGMLGWGHNPKWIKESLSCDQVQSNIMTPSANQYKFMSLLNSAIGYEKESPYTTHTALNSGSEAVSFALRIARSNITNPKPMPPAYIRMSGSFHGRTDLPAYLSDSTENIYCNAIPDWHFSSPKVITIPYNDVSSLRNIRSTLPNYNIIAAIMEPVQGEGNPGNAMSRVFYDELRNVTKDIGATLIADSIQSGIRTNGCLSIVDYPGFENIEAPDIEIFSKALNAGQYPLSLVSMKSNIIYANGIYGNTMTANPRALEVGIAVLTRLDRSLQSQIITNGNIFLQRLEELANKHPNIVDSVNGTGLLCAMELNKNINVMEIERMCRENGLNVIHGGQNALRFTPYFEITEDEMEYCVFQTLDSVFNDIS